MLIWRKLKNLSTCSNAMRPELTKFMLSPEANIGNQLNKAKQFGLHQSHKAVFYVLLCI